MDTRDRASGSGALVLNTAISGLAESVGKRAESAAARDQRIDGRLDALTAADEQLRAAVSVVQQASLVLKREVARLGASVRSECDGARGRRRRPDRRSHRRWMPTSISPSRIASADRGTRSATRMASYLPFFEGASDVLDVGCGRGEFLELLAGAGVSGRGIDLNHEMAETCRARGLDVTEADAVGYLASLPDGALGGLFAAQVVEHLQPAYLLAFLELAFHKIRPGGRLVLETLNPACWVAFFESYIRDITHVWPLHPETLQFLVVASGFGSTGIEYRSPVETADKLQPVTATAAMGPVLADLVDSFNLNVEKLNSRMFTFLDYAVIATR